MKIKLQEVIKNSKYWLQEVCIWEYDPKILVEGKKYDLVGIYNYERLDNPYLSYKKLGGKGKEEYEQIGIDNVDFVYIEGDFEKEIQRKINSLGSST